MGSSASIGNAIMEDEDSSSESITPIGAKRSPVGSVQNQGITYQIPKTNDLELTWRFTDSSAGDVLNGDIVTGEQNAWAIHDIHTDQCVNVKEVKLLPEPNILSSNERYPSPDIDFGDELRIRAQDEQIRHTKVDIDELGACGGNSQDSTPLQELSIQVTDVLTGIVDRDIQTQYSVLEEQYNIDERPALSNNALGVISETHIYTIRPNIKAAVRMATGPDSENNVMSNENDFSSENIMFGENDDMTCAHNDVSEEIVMSGEGVVSSENTFNEIAAESNENDIFNETEMVNENVATYSVNASEISPIAIGYQMSTENAMYTENDRDTSNANASDDFDLRVDIQEEQCDPDESLQPSDQRTTIGSNIHPPTYESIAYIQPPSYESLPDARLAPPSVDSSNGARPRHSWNGAQRSPPQETGNMPSSSSVSSANLRVYIPSRSPSPHTSDNGYSRSPSPRTSNNRYVQSPSPHTSNNGSSRSSSPETSDNGSLSMFTSSNLQVPISPRRRPAKLPIKIDSDFWKYLSSFQQEFIKEVEQSHAVTIETKPTSQSETQIEITANSMNAAKDAETTLNMKFDGLKADFKSVFVDHDTIPGYLILDDLQEVCSIIIENTGTKYKILGMDSDIQLLYMTIYEGGYDSGATGNPYTGANFGQTQSIGATASAPPLRNYNTATNYVPADFQAHTPTLIGAFTINNHRILVENGDITKLDLQCIASSASADLSQGSGVAGAVLRAAGQDLQRWAEEYIRRHGPLGVACTAVSPGYYVHCDIIVHIVGPQWDHYDDKTQCYKDLKRCFANCLKEANEYACDAVAIPAISSGNYGVPLEVVAAAMAEEVNTYCSTGTGTLGEIHLVDINGGILDHIKAAFDALLQGIPLPGLDAYLDRTGQSRGPIASPQDQTAGTPTFIPGIDLIPRFTDMFSAFGRGLNPGVSNPNTTANLPTTPAAKPRKSFRQKSTNETCVICFNVIKKPYTLPKCGHVFCKACIKESFKKFKSECPTCRTSYRGHKI